MIWINVRNFGNQWSNMHEVEQQLSVVTPDDHVVFYCWEGISIRSSGLLTFITNWQSQTGHPDTKISIYSVNKKERFLPYPNICTYANMVWGVNNLTWWKTPAQFVDCSDTAFGLFVGRDSTSRLAIMYDCHCDWKHSFIFSRLNQDPPDAVFYDNSIENLNDWVSTQHRDDFDHFWQTDPVQSLDNMQFGQHLVGQDSINAAVSLLEHYNKFGVELVLETMTVGETFFPTEKTVRPIVGLKPFVIHATRKYLKYLRALGFQTFGDIWDESYDDYEGVDRWKKMKNVVQYIIDRPEVIKLTKPIVEHNKKLLLTNRLHKNPRA